ncbi:unnamed protein product [Tenebrio molitor]|nr:unnamed protein product [Tenebrio molitor]
MDKGIQRAFRERYPELRFGDREVDVVEQTTRVRSQLPGEVARRKVVKIMHDGMEGDLWSKFCELRKETESDVRVAMHHVNSMGTERLRKMAEAVFHGTGTTVAIYTTQAKMEEGRKGEGKREKKTYALIVEKKGTQYKDVLSSVKTAITGDPARSSIHTMRSTRDGNLLITLDKDDETIEELEKAIKQAAGDLAVRRARSDSGTEVLHVRGLDATTNKGEVIEALKVRLGMQRTKRGRSVTCGQIEMTHRRSLSSFGRRMPKAS